MQYISRIAAANLAAANRAPHDTEKLLVAQEIFKRTYSTLWKSLKSDMVVNTTRDGWSRCMPKCKAIIDDLSEDDWNDVINLILDEARKRGCVAELLVDEKNTNKIKITMFDSADVKMATVDESMVEEIDKKPDLSDVPLLFTLITLAAILFFAVNWTKVTPIKLGFLPDMDDSDESDYDDTEVVNDAETVPRQLKRKSTLQLAAMSMDGLKRAIGSSEDMFKAIVERNAFVRDLLKESRREMLQLRMQQDSLWAYLKALLYCRLREHIEQQRSQKLLRDMHLSLPAVRMRPRSYMIDRERDISLTFRQARQLRATIEGIHWSRGESDDLSVVCEVMVILSEASQKGGTKGAVRAFRFWAFADVDMFETKLERFADSWLRSEFALIGLLELIVHKVQELSHLPPRSCSDVSVFAKIVEVELIGWAAKQDWQIAEIRRRKAAE
ncbi:hypothetical protein FOL47_007611, partial [Perkinsus chesapeaki]